MSLLSCSVYYSEGHKAYLCVVCMCVCVDICACIYTQCWVMVSTVKAVERGMENDVIFGK